MTPLLPVIVVVVVVFLVLIAVIVSQSFLNGRLKEEIKSEEDSHAKSRKEHSEKEKSLSETIVQVMETNKQLNECNNEIISLMEQHTPSMEGLIKDNANLLAAQERLVACIRYSGIRDKKGIPRKATEEQIVRLLLGMGDVVPLGYGRNNVLDASIKAGAFAPNAVELERLEPTQGGSVGASKPSRDWNVPQAFPEFYIIPEGIEVVSIIEDGNMSIGHKGITKEEDSVPYCKWENIKRRYAMKSDELAPINPTDHPEHPQFNNKKA